MNSAGAQGGMMQVFARKGSAGVICMKLCELRALEGRKTGGFVPRRPAVVFITAQDNRKFVMGVLRVLRNGAHWRHLPAHYGGGQSLRRRQAAEFYLNLIRSPGAIAVTRFKSNRNQVQPKEPPGVRPGTTEAARPDRTGFTGLKHWRALAQDRHAAPPEESLLLGRPACGTGNCLLCL